MLHPGQISTGPVAHRKDHLRDVTGHGWQVGTAVASRVHDYLVSALSQGHTVTCEDIIAID